MNLNGRDYVFSKAIGDAEWWSKRRRIKERKTKQQEQKLCTSFSAVNRYFNILPHPGTGLVSGNVFGVFENSDKPKGLWGTVKENGGVLKHTRLAFAERETDSGRLSFWLLHFLESKHFTSYRCSGPGWPAPATGGPFNITPVDEKHLDAALKDSVLP